MPVPRGKSNSRPQKTPLEGLISPPFAEALAWKKIGAGWQPLFGGYRDSGFSLEWHEFTPKIDFDWSQSFHPGSIELCLNLNGRGIVSNGQQTIELLPQMFTFYFQGQPPLTATRCANDEHRFITIEFSPAFLIEYFSRNAEHIHPLVKAVIAGEAIESMVAPAERLTLALRQIAESLRHCPVHNPAQEVWFRSKTLEVASYFFFQSNTGELPCTRTQRLARERIAKAKTILTEQMQNPPTLEELARILHCSPFYLSRQFPQEGGMTMQQFLRQTRMERAAELLRTGKCNVTEAAFEVGYNSLSHFSSAFHETFGCCPGLYPLRTEVQQAILSKR